MSDYLRSVGWVAAAVAAGLVLAVAVITTADVFMHP